MKTLIRELVVLLSSKNLATLIASSLRTHFPIICHRLSCVVQSENSGRSSTSGQTVRRHLLAAFGLYLLATLYGLFLLQWEGSLGCHRLSCLSLRALRSSPHIAIRQMYVPVMWPQSDQVILVIFATHMAILLHFGLARPMESQNLFFALKVGGGGGEDSRTDSVSKVYLNAKSTPNVVKFVCFKFLFLFSFFCLLRNERQ